MAEKAKSVRLLKAAKELNIGTSTITSFLEDKGFKVDNKPTAKLSEEMYEVLLREFADEKLIKEKAEQVELGKTIKEAAKQVEEDKEAAATAAAAAAKVEVEEPKEEEKVSPKAETLKGPKILGKIDLNATSKKKEKKKEEPVAKTEKPIKEEKPAPVAKKEEATAPKKEEKPVVAKEEPKDAAEPASKKDEVEKHKTSFKSLEGPKIMGKIDLPVEQKKKKLVASSSDDASKTKKKRKKIKVNPDKVQGDKKPANT